MFDIKKNIPNTENSKELSEEKTFMNLNLTLQKKLAKVRNISISGRGME